MEPKTVKPEGEVSRVINELCLKTEILLKKLDGLETQLVPALSQGVPVGRGEALAVPEYSSDIAQKINSIVRTLDGINGRMSVLSDRIEL